MIIGKNINIRPMETKDIELFYNWDTSQESMGDYMSAEMYYKESYIENLKKTLSGERNRTFMLIIEDKTGTPVGILNYFDSASSNVSIDFGIMIADKASRGKGIGKEAVSLLVDYLFNTKSIMRIQYITRADNEGMKSLGQKLGFTQEGILRQFRFDHGEYWDHLLFSIIRDDWKALKH